LKVDGTIVVSETECEIPNREISGANVTTIPILFSVKDNRASFDERRDVFFLGGYQHKPNVDAVFYFVKSIWPLVKQKLPEAKFYVLGSNVTQEILALATDDVVVVGYVEDLSHYLDRCRMSVVPLRYGASMQGKIGTSMSYGVPSVATSIAVEGLGLKQGENILVGDTPENFAQEVVTLYTDKRLWDHLSISGLAFVEAHWSIQVGERKLTEFLGQLTGTPFCSSVSQDTLEHSADTRSASLLTKRSLV
jgi:glycosyltransferase involved in cell wall biosynthesis